MFKKIPAFSQACRSWILSCDLIWLCKVIHASPVLYSEQCDLMGLGCHFSIGHYGMFSRHPLAFREAEKFHLSSFIIDIIGTCCPWYIFLLSFLAWSRSFVTSDRDEHILEGWWRQLNVLNSHCLFHRHMRKCMHMRTNTHTVSREEKKWQLLISCDWAIWMIGNSNR